MKKIIQSGTQLNYYEKYIKLWKKDIQPFLHFLWILFITILNINIKLIVYYPIYCIPIIWFSLVICVVIIWIYLRFYKKPKMEFECTII